jgi:hypothetical protein
LQASGTGGSNGATMRFAPECNHGANKGLAIAREALEPIKAAHPGFVYICDCCWCGPRAPEATRREAYNFFYSCFFFLDCSFIHLGPHLVPPFLPLTCSDAQTSRMQTCGRSLAARQSRPWVGHVCPGLPAALTPPTAPNAPSRAACPTPRRCACVCVCVCVCVAPLKCPSPPPTRKCR